MSIQSPTQTSKQTSPQAAAQEKAQAFTQPHAETTAQISPQATAQSIRTELAACADPQRAAHCLRFFKTGPGEYGEHDRFWGISMPQLRNLVRRRGALALRDAEDLLRDPIHEVRACALLFLYARFSRSDGDTRARIISLYLRNSRHVNNWDLVDMSCGMLGHWLLPQKDRSLLARLAGSANMWEQRMAVVGTLPLIKHGEFTEILALADGLCRHPHDRMHKALGWMLRELGKKDKQTLETFLAAHCRTLPRTTLRYAIERFPEAERQYWLHR